MPNSINTSSVPNIIAVSHAGQVNDTIAAKPPRRGPNKRPLDRGQLGKERRVTALGRTKVDRRGPEANRYSSFEFRVRILKHL